MFYKGGAFIIAFTCVVAYGCLACLLYVGSSLLHFSFLDFLAIYKGSD